MTDPAKEASFYIHRIMEERCTLTASSVDQNASIVTAIVDIRDDESEVVFEYSGSKHVDNLIRQSRSLDFSTCVDDVSITFSSVGAVEDTTHNGSPAFMIAMPRSLDRAQRRDFYRVSLPLLERPKCVMEHDGTMYKATVVDISIGGISAFVRNAAFEAGDVIETCRITTPIGIEIEAALEVVYVGDALDGMEVQYGCMFKDANALLESKLQRYVTYLQGKANAKRRDIT